MNYRDQASYTKRSRPDETDDEGAGITLRVSLTRELSARGAVVGEWSDRPCIAYVDADSLQRNADELAKRGERWVGIEAAARGVIGATSDYARVAAALSRMRVPGPGETPAAHLTRAVGDLESIGAGLCPCPDIMGSADVWLARVYVWDVPDMTQTAYLVIVAYPGGLGWFCLGTYVQGQ
ncbi:MAG: hypothetical protein M0R22_06320 [Dehalococcoidia bacterium]|jgi:hypothetical protein|nr:hypothetical protein [Dehalococcoidia bacterium]